MQLDILTPESKIFSGNVYGVQLPGVDGSFEVLNRHAAMVAALRKGKMKILTDKQKSEVYEISSGFVEVMDNKTTILLESAKPLSK